MCTSGYFDFINSIRKYLKLIFGARYFYTYVGDARKCVRSSVPDHSNHRRVGKKFLNFYLFFDGWWKVKKTIWKCVAFFSFHTYVVRVVGKGVWLYNHSFIRRGRGGLIRSNIKTTPYNFAERFFPQQTGVFKDLRFEKFEFVDDFLLRPILTLTPSPSRKKDV